MLKRFSPLALSGLFIAFFLFGFPATGSALTLLNNNPLEAISGCFACGGCMLPIALFVLSVVLLIWVARDAKARGMDNAVVWMLVVFFLNVLGLVIYLFSRPKGELMPCSNCGNKRMQSSLKCPHCGS